MYTHLQQFLLPQNKPLTQSSCLCLESGLRCMGRADLRRSETVRVYLEQHPGCVSLATSQDYQFFHRTTSHRGTHYLQAIIFWRCFDCSEALLISLSFPETFLHETFFTIALTQEEFVVTGWKIRYPHKPRNGIHLYVMRNRKLLYV